MASRVGIRFLSVNELFTPAELLPVDKLPSIDALRVAAEINVTSESGAPVLFGSLFTGQKTIVCFIRHFWCVGFRELEAFINLYLGVHYVKIT